MKSPDAVATPHDTLTVLLNVDVLTHQMAQYRHTGNRLHLLHAARALEEARETLRLMLGGPKCG